MFAVSTERRTTRCGNCPSNGCANCPIASKYPEFQKKRARRERKRRELIKAQKAEAAENLGILRDGGGDIDVGVGLQSRLGDPRGRGRSVSGSD